MVHIYKSTAKDKKHAVSGIGRHHTHVYACQRGETPHAYHWYGTGPAVPRPQPGSLTFPPRRRADHAYCSSPPTACLAACALAAPR